MSVQATSASDRSAEGPAEQPRRVVFILRWFVLAALIGFLFAGLCSPGMPLYGYELKTLDSRFRYRSEILAPQSVAIVAIDERSINDPRLGRWPWPRQAHAQLLRRLKPLHPRAIAFDVIFAEPSTIADDAAFVDACKACDNVYFGLHEGQLRTRVRGAGTPETFAVEPGLLAHRDRLTYVNAMVAPQAALAGAAAGGGAIVGCPDSDGIVRRSLLLVQEKTSQGTFIYPSLVLELAIRTQGRTYDDVQADFTRQLSLPGGKDVPLDTSGRLLTNFIGPAGTVPTISYVDVLDGRVNAADFRDKIVFVGFSAEGMLDQHPTPVGPKMTGVEVQAQTLDSLLAGRYLKASTSADTFGLTLGLALLAASAGIFLRPITGLALVALLMGGYNVAGLQAFGSSGAIWPSLSPNLAMLSTFGAIAVFRLVTEEAARKRLRDEFGRYAPPQVVARLDAGQMKARGAGVKRPVTALFADIRGFTAWSATADPHDVIAVLNTYFESVTQLAFDVEGTVDNIVGDEIFVTFNAIQDQPDHPQRAVDLAVNMIAALDGLNAHWVKHGILPQPMRIGVGLNSGEALIGNLGSHIRTQYTALGQTINLAARLQALNKELGTTILATAEVVSELGPEIEVRSRGMQEIRGHPEPIEVFEIIGRKFGVTGSSAVDPAASC